MPLAIHHSEYAKEIEIEAVNMMMNRIHCTRLIKIIRVINMNPRKTDSGD